VSLVAVTAVPGSRGVSTVAAALALTWPAEVLLADLDGTGGDLGAWFDLPATPNLTTAIAAASHPNWTTISAHTHLPSVGMQVLAAPVRSREATAAVTEAANRLVPVLSAHPGVHVIADTGRSVGALGPVAAQAATVVVTIAQTPGSTRATAAIIDRTAELLDWCATRAMPTRLAVIGDDPYPTRDIEVHLGRPCHLIPIDPLGAAVIAGRPATGRLATRSRVLRSTARLAHAIHDDLAATVGAR
jgi:MinD-like ATPase involved in chromosome partitioning or flagellar assembly